MEKKVTIDGWTFTLSDEKDFYECRGSVCYDDEHDEIPDPSLWDAALTLEQQLKDEGYIAECNYSEKGWVEIEII